LDIVFSLIWQVLQEHEPLLTYHLYDEFIEVEGKSEPSEKEPAYNKLITLLPPTNKDLLTFVIRHLRQVSPCTLIKPWMGWHGMI